MKAKFILPLLAATALSSCTIVFGGTSGSQGHSCSFHQQVESEAFLAEEAGCEHGTKYFYSCSCGAKGSETFEVGQGLGHVFDGGEFVTSDEQVMVITVIEDEVAVLFACARCGKENCREDTKRANVAGHRHYAHEYTSQENGTHQGSCAVCKESFVEQCEHAKYRDEEPASCHKCGSKPQA